MVNWKGKRERYTCKTQRLWSLTVSATATGVVNYEGEWIVGQVVLGMFYCMSHETARTLCLTVE